MKKRAFIIVYYILLLLLFLSNSDGVEPPEILRFLFVGAITIPVLFVNHINFPVIITLFYSLTIFGISYSYMPYTLSLYVVLLIVVTILIGPKYKISKIPVFLIIMPIYILVIDVMGSVDHTNGYIVENILWCFCILLFFFRFSKKTPDHFPLCFELIAIILSVLFFLNKEKFAVNYGLEKSLERSSWVDPNYFGMVIGMGTICAIFKILSNQLRDVKLVEKIIAILTLTISIPVLILNASRGALLAVIIALVILFLLQDVKLKYKIYFVLLSIAGIFYLYNNEYFDLLAYRIMEDEGTGSGRTEIWASKLKMYSQGNILKIIFGYGYYHGMNITGQYCGFHNEYIGFVVEYGLVGLAMLLYMMYYPIKIAIKSKVEVITIIIYLLVCFMTLEPFGLGILTFYSFYLYGLLLALNEQESIVITN